MYNTYTKDILKAQQGSENAMEKIVIENSGLIWSIVNRFLNRGYPKEELYQIGCIGFIKAIKRFDLNYEVKISTYAVPYIIGEIKRFLRDDGPIKISRSTKELAIKIKELQRIYFLEKGEEIKISKIAENLQVTKQEVIYALEAIRPIESIDEEAYEEDVGGESKLSKISNNKDETNTLINKISIQNLIKELNEKEKQIIILRYYKEKTQTEIAKILGISQVQVSRIEKKALILMREKIA